MPEEPYRLSANLRRLPIALHPVKSRLRMMNRSHRSLSGSKESV